MNWRNPFITSYLAVTVVGTLALGYFVYSASSRYATASAEYDAAVGELHQLQNKTPFPSDENNQAFAALTRQYKAEYDRLLAEIAKLQSPVESLTPQAFQDRLRQFVSEVSAAAEKNGVRLNEGFYLGFDRYRDTLPSNDAAGPLARQLDAIRGLVDKLVAFKVTEIREIRRELLPVEGGAPAPAPAAPSGPGKRPPAGAPKAPAAPVVIAEPFEISFVADQARLRQSLNAIVTADHFFVIRSLTVENESQEGPKRAVEAPVPGAEIAPAPDANPAALLSGDSATPAGNALATSSMRLLVGRENVTISARIEMLTFQLPSTASK